MAAAALGLSGPTIADLVAGLRWPTPGVEVGLVETAGGIRSPQADDGDVLDLVAALVPDHLVLVADAGLGTLNLVRLSLAALAPGSAAPPLVVLNRYDPASDLHRRNRAWLLDVDGLDTTPATGPDLTALAARLAPG
jgi:dethiobiotin synthetase